MQKQLRKIKKYLSFLNDYIFTNEKQIDNIYICKSDYKTSNNPPSVENFIPFNKGDSWGDGVDSHSWFHFEIEIPNEMKHKPIVLSIKTYNSGWDADNPQFLVYVNGKMRQGLDINHTLVWLNEDCNYDIYVYAYTGRKVSSSQFYATILNLNENVQKLYYDVCVPLETVSCLDEYSKEYVDIITYLYDTISMIDTYELGSKDFYDSVDKALSFISEEFYEKYCSTDVRRNVSTIVGVGHTHIDCAFLWTLKQTREKVQRSFSTVIELMKRYPEYKFMSSQALLYKYVKEEAPSLYAEIKERVKEGRWEVEGASWVEADCNMTSGKSLIRQILYGKNFFKKEFDVDTHIMFLPDVFGFSAAFPQILRKSGIDWLIASKISWNDTNTMPYDTFKWIGLDGSEINTYFLSTQDYTKGSPQRRTTYRPVLEPKTVVGTWKRYGQKNLNNEALITFGHGDGGGGVTYEMLEKAKRMTKGIPGAPIFKIDFINDFLKRLEQQIKNNKNTPSWRGELYLEYHRGTYTSMAKNKRNNRRSEFLLLDAECHSIISNELFGSEIPHKTLHDNWELTLTNQFHDILPGTSIRQVYEQSDKDYKVIMDSANDIIETSKLKIASKLNKKNGYVVFNPHSYNVDGVVKVDGLTALVKDVPSKGYKLTNDFIKKNSVKIENNRVETNSLSVTFDYSMLITSIYDKENNREIIKEGGFGNEIRIYPDHPDYYDAWEWNEYSLDSPYLVLKDVESTAIVDDGARRGIKIVRPFKQSKITQTIWFFDDGLKIDFDTVADWHQQHLMVKTFFSTNINADKATYEIQFGTVERPTHKNTSWDKAKFEVCAQKYADLSEGGYGVSIINDCKYGHDIHDGSISLSLIKSATFPNEDADQGDIPFVYSLYLHAGDFSQSKTTEIAYYNNYPLTAIKASGDKSEILETFSVISFDKDNVVCETLKKSEDGNGTIIRFYESKNKRSEVAISIGLDFDKAYLCDLMENELCELKVDKGCIKLDVGCFEIVTIKLKKNKITEYVEEDKENQLIFLTPILKEMVWGGERLQKFGYDLKSNKTGESWAISGHDKGACIVRGGCFDGKSLSELWKNNEKLFGDVKGDCFPLLIKIIDAKDDLSIQVHPDDDYAKINENSSLGKTECWYVLDCEDKSTIIIGHNAKDKAELKKMIKNEKWKELLREIPIKRGDFFQIPAGCVHAIKGGALILETQQSSDVTYRLYDYNRLQNGKKRELHIKKAIDVIKAPFVETAINRKIKSYKNYKIEQFVSCEFYTVEKIQVNGDCKIIQPYGFMNFTVIEGCGVANKTKIKKGDSFIALNNCKSISFSGSLTMIVSYVK